MLRTPEAKIDFKTFSLTRLHQLAIIHDPKTLHGPEITRPQTELLDYFTFAVDQSLGVAADKEHPHLARVLAETKATSTIDHTVRLVAQQISHEYGAACVPILFGSVPAIERLVQLRRGYRSNPVFPILVQRSHGTNLDGGRVVGRIDTQAFLTSVPLIIFDDLLDYGGAIAKTFSFIRSHITGNPEPYWLTQLRRGLDQIPKNDLSQGTGLYVKLSELLADMNIVVAVPFSKNRPFIESLRATADQSRWGSVQLKLLEAVQNLSPHAWVMGSGIDTGVPWNNIAVQISRDRPDLATHPQHQWLFRALKDQLLRVGTQTSGLIQVNGPDAATCYNRVVEFTVRSWTNILDKLK